jgi:hypothetical protein
MRHPIQSQLYGLPHGVLHVLNTFGKLYNHISLMTQPIYYLGDIRQATSKIQCQTENFSISGLTLSVNLLAT